MLPDVKLLVTQVLQNLLVVMKPYSVDDERWFIVVLRVWLILTLVRALFS